MSDLVKLGKSREVPAAPRAAIALPHTVRLPTRFYGRMALAETARQFAEVAEIAYAIGDGAIEVTFSRIDGDAHEVIGEFLNHTLYASATEITR